jgi:hypothetical protein
MKVTNNSRATTYDFVKAGGKAKDGVPETVSHCAWRNGNARCGRERSGALARRYCVR